MQFETLASQELWEKHPELFHYTDFFGVVGILESQSLRATHWRCLNDKEEVKQFQELLPELLRSAFEREYNALAKTDKALKILVNNGASLNSIYRHDAEIWADLMYEALIDEEPNKRFFEVFITSFCTPDGDYKEVRNHGLLSQWRCYGKNGGYALVFDTEALLRLMRQEENAWKCVWSCGPVTYSSEDLSQQFEALSDFKKALSTCNFRTNDSIEPILSPFLRCAAHYKHWAFFEEREVRLVIILNGKKMTEAFGNEGQRTLSSFSRENGTVVPCLNVFEGLPSDRSFRLPIKRIIVGPGSEQLEREKKLKAFLAEKKYDIAVTCSEIPLRF